METERVVIEVVKTGDYWYAQACVQLSGGDKWKRLELSPSRSRAQAIAYALTEAAVAFERGEIGP